MKVPAGRVRPAAMELTNCYCLMILPIVGRRAILILHSTLNTSHAQ